MKKIKHIAAVLIVVFLLYANVNLAYNTFISNENNISRSIKSVIKPDDVTVSSYADSVFHGMDLAVLNDPLEENKWIVTSNNTKIGFAYTIHEAISCPSCSDVNYLVFTDAEYTVLSFIFLRDIIEGNKIYPVSGFEENYGRFIRKNLLKDEIEKISIKPAPEKHAIMFKKSIVKLSQQVRLFHDA